MASGSPAVEIEVDDKVVRVSNPDRVYFPERGETKLDLVEYYLSVGDGIVNALRERPVHAAPVPDGRDGGEGPPEAAAQGSAAVDGDRAGVLPALEPHRRRALRHRAGTGDLGGADEHRGVPPVEQPSGRRREARRVAHRPRPRSALHVGDRPAGRARGPRGARRPRRHRLPQDQRRQGDAHLRADPARPRLQGRTPRRARLRPRGGAPLRGGHHRLVAQGPGPARPVRRLQPERPRPHDRGRLLGARQPDRHRQCAGPLGGDRRLPPRRLHHRDHARALRRARRPARRDRRRGLRHRAAAGVGRAGRGGRRGAAGRARRSRARLRSHTIAGWRTDRDASPQLSKCFRAPLPGDGPRDQNVFHFTQRRVV